MLSCCYLLFSLCSIPSNHVFLCVISIESPPLQTPTTPPSAYTTTTTMAYWTAQTTSRWRALHLWSFISTPSYFSPASIRYSQAKWLRDGREKTYLVIRWRCDQSDRHSHPTGVNPPLKHQIRGQNSILSSSLTRISLIVPSFLFKLGVLQHYYMTSTKEYTDGIVNVNIHWQGPFCAS